MRWRDAGGSDLQTDTIAIPALNTTRQRGGATVSAPSGTARVAIELVGGPTAAGSTFFFDDVVVEGTVAPTTTTTTR